MLAFQPQHPIMQDIASTSTENILKQSTLVDQGLPSCQGQSACVLNLSGPFALFDVLKHIGRKHECSELRVEIVAAVQSLDSSLPFGSQARRRLELHASCSLPEATVFIIDEQSLSPNTKWAYSGLSCFQLSTCFGTGFAASGTI